MLLPKFIQNLLTYADGYEVRVSLCNLLKENYCVKAKLIKIKFIYRAMHACIEFTVTISDRKKYSLRLQHGHSVCNSQDDRS